jgi:hypothetical protein
MLARYHNLETQRMATGVGSQAPGDPGYDPERCFAHVVSGKTYRSAATSNASANARAARGDTHGLGRQKGEADGDI